MEHQMFSLSISLFLSHSRSPSSCLFIVLHAHCFACCSPSMRVLQRLEKDGHSHPPRLSKATASAASHRRIYSTSCWTEKVTAPPTAPLKCLLVHLARCIYFYLATDQGQRDLLLYQINMQFQPYRVLFFFVFVFA